MSKGSYSADVYYAADRYRKATGISAFYYTDSGDHTTVHPDLNPKNITRECRSSPEYPAATPVIIVLDHTGSMAEVPRELQLKMVTLTGLLLRKSYLTDPQIMFAAVGDATSDSAPLQTGQFEADNAMDSDLGKLLLQGGGGGTCESYELPLYFAARHVAANCWTRRGPDGTDLSRRGYLIFIGDEKAYMEVSHAQVASIMGDALQDSIPFDDILAEAQKLWDVYFIMPGAANHAGDARIISFWQHHLGQNFIQVASTDAIPETIALTIGLAEGAIDLPGGLRHLRDVGSDAGGVVGTALATFGSSRSPVTVTPAPPDLTGPSGNVRL
jgi:hypothetical protein